MAETEPEGATPDTGTTTVPDRPEIPEWAEGIAPKFIRDTPEETARAINESYANLEKKLGARDPKDLSIMPSEPLVEDKGAAEDFDAFLSQAELKPEEVAERWREKGELTRGQYEKFKSAGIGRPLVDQIMRAMSDSVNYRALQQDVLRDTAAHAAGGEDALDELLGYAAENFSKEQLKPYNTLIASGDKESVRMAVRILADMRAGKQGRAGKIVEGQAVAGGTGGYRTYDEFAQGVAEWKRAGQPASHPHMKRVARTDDTILRNMR